MNRSEANELAQKELSHIQQTGYGVASEHIDSVVLKEVEAPSGTTYVVEISYQWEGAEHQEILVICRVTTRAWFEHQRLERSIKLTSGLHC